MKDTDTQESLPESEMELCLLPLLGSPSTLTCLSVAGVTDIREIRAACGEDHEALQEKQKRVRKKQLKLTSKSDQSTSCLKKKRWCLPFVSSVVHFL